MVPDLTISSINHNNPELLRQSLRSLHAHTHRITFDVWIVDNATDGRLVDEIRAEFPNAKWLFNDRKNGFSTNHNRVLACAEGRYVCLLNDDTLIHDGALDELVRFLDQNPRAGMAGPRLLNPDGSSQNSAFRDKSLLGELIDISLLPGAANRIKRWGIDPAQFADRSARVDWVLGACIVVRRQALRQIGLLDEVLSPVANCEEIDFCRRARQAGWDVAFVPSAKVLHYGGQSMKRHQPGADFYRVEMYRATLAYFHKHCGRMSSALLRLIYLITLPWNALMLGQSVLRGRTDRAQAASHWATLLRIGAVALKPLKRSTPRPGGVSPPAKPQVAA